MILNELIEEVCNKHEITISLANYFDKSPKDIEKDRQKLIMYMCNNINVGGIFDKCMADILEQDILLEEAVYRCALKFMFARYDIQQQFVDKIDKLDDIDKDADITKIKDYIFENEKEKEFMEIVRKIMSYCAICLKRNRSRK